MTVYMAHIRPLLEFGSTVWNTGYLSDLRLLESVQCHWTEQIDRLFNLSYADQLKSLNLYSVQGRLLRADLIKYWRIFHDSSATAPLDLFTISLVTSTRGHRFKVAKPHVSTKWRRRYFSIRCINHWNSLPDSVVSAVTINLFERGLHHSLGEALFSFTDW